jgi:hypothetical protein
MKFIVSYIDTSTVYWAGLEFDENLVLADKIEDIQREIIQNLNVVESGQIRRIKPENYVSNESTSDGPSGDEYHEKDLSGEDHPEDTIPSFTYDTGFGFLESDLTTDIEIELPFSDKKKAEKILPLQIQDRLPFDLSDSHSVVFPGAQYQTNAHTYFYTSIEKRELNDIILSCKNNGIKLCSLHPQIHAANAVFSTLALPDENIVPVVIFEGNDSLIISSSKNGKILHARNIKLAKNTDILPVQITAQLAITFRFLLDKYSVSDSSILKILLLDYTKDDSSIDFNQTSHEFKISNFRIPMILPENDNSIKMNPLLSTLAIYSSFGICNRDKGNSVNDLKLSLNIYPNIRSGEFRYRAPLTEIKNSFYNELVPFGLLLFFGLLSVILTYFFSPLKQQSLDQKTISAVTYEALKSAVPPGKELVALEDRVYQIESELGDMSALRSLSSIEWIHLVSKTIPANIPLEIDSLSITTKGISFRGTVPDYPTSGRVSSLLESLKSSDPEKFCSVELKTEDVAIGVNSKQIRAEVTLCE